MAKQAGLGDALFVAGYDLSGDVGAVQAINASLALLDVTAIDKSARERIGGLRDGEITFNNFFNDDDSAGSEGSFEVLNALRSGSNAVHVIYCRSEARGKPAAGLIAKQVDYNLNRGADGSLLGTVQTLGAAGYGLEWGIQLTAGKANATGASQTTGVDIGATASLGLVAYLMIFDFDGTDVTFTLQESSDNGGSDAYAGVTGGAFTQVVAGHTCERIATATNQAIEEYLRVALTTSGGFSSVDYAVIVIVPGSHSG